MAKLVEVYPKIVAELSVPPQWDDAGGIEWPYQWLQAVVMRLKGVVDSAAPSARMVSVSVASTQGDIVWVVGDPPPNPQTVSVPAAVGSPRDGVLELRTPKMTCVASVPNRTTHDDIVAAFTTDGYLAWAQGQFKTRVLDRWPSVTVVAWSWKLASSLGVTRGRDLD